MLVTYEHKLRKILHQKLIISLCIHHYLGEKRESICAHCLLFKRVAHLKYTCLNKGGKFTMVPQDLGETQAPLLEHRVENVNSQILSMECRGPRNMELRVLQAVQVGCFDREGIGSTGDRIMFIGTEACRLRKPLFK